MRLQRRTTWRWHRRGTRSSGWRSAEHRVPAVVGLLVLAALETEGQSTTLVVGDRKDDRLRLVVVVGGVLIHPVDNGLDHLVVLENVVDVADGVVVVRSVVDARTLDHDKVRHVLLAETVERGERHLLERRLLGGVSVNLVGHVRRGKETKRGKLERVAALESVKVGAVVDQVEADVCWLPG